MTARGARNRRTRRDIVESYVPYLFRLMHHVNIFDAAGSGAIPASYTGSKARIGGRLPLRRAPD
jgi:hypothetical protein